MTENKLYKLVDLVEEIKKLDQMIDLHSQNDSESGLMLDQYRAKKVKLVGYFITELNSPSLKSEKSFQLIKKLLNKVYSNVVPGTAKEDREDYSLLESVLG